MEKIMVVEDDLALSAGLCFELDSSGYLTVAAYNCQKARQLLTATQYPINEIAVTVGYADQSSFTKAFKRVTGITPYQLRT